MHRIHSLIAAATLGLFACGSETTSNAKLAAAADNDVIERSDALNVMSSAVCDRYKDLGQIGVGSKAEYASEDDCRAKQHDRWANVWSEDSCGVGHGLIAGKVRECRDRAKTWATSDNVLDFGGLLTQCSARSVCRH